MTVMNQANADHTDIPDDAVGLANAGLGAGGAWEGRESDPGSANPNWDESADGFPTAGPGREDEADGLDEISQIEAYRATIQDLDLDAMPIDATAAPPEEDATEAPAAEDEPAPDEPEEGRAPQYRIRPRSRVGQKAFELMKGDPYLAEEDAFAMARQELGLDPQDIPDPEVDAEPQAEADGETVEAVESRIRELRRQVIGAKREYDVDREAELEEEILALEEQLPEIRLREEVRRRQESEADEAWNRASAASWEAVQADFPQAADPNSSFATRMLEIDEAWMEAGDARFDNPDKARVIAAIVAKEQGVRPGPVAPASRVPAGRSLPSPASSRPSAPASRPGPVVVMPASGASRTAADTPTTLEVALARAQTPEDYEALRDRILAGA